MVHGVPLVWNEKTSELSMGSLTNEFRSLVLSDNTELDSKLFPEKYAEDIICRLGKQFINLLLL